MADFLPTSITKAALRSLRYPHATIAGLKTLVDGIVSGNPWSCVPYQRSGMTMPPVEITRQTYTGTVMYQDSMGKIIGKVTVAVPNLTGFNSAINDILTDPDLETFMDGMALHDPLMDKATLVVRACWMDGDVFNVTFTRDAVRLSAYSNDDIINNLEIWADAIPALG